MKLLALVVLVAEVQWPGFVTCVLPARELQARVVYYSTSEDTTQKVALTLLRDGWRDPSPREPKTFRVVRVEEAWTEPIEPGQSRVPCMEEQP